MCNLTPEDSDILKILWKRGEISPLFSTIFCYLLFDFHVKTGTKFSLRDKRSRHNGSRLYIRLCRGASNEYPQRVLFFCLVFFFFFMQNQENCQYVFWCFFFWFFFVLLKIYLLKCDKLLTCYKSIVPSPKNKNEM